jgi:hypothetical protein
MTIICRNERVIEKAEGTPQRILRKYAILSQMMKARLQVLPGSKVKKEMPVQNNRFQVNFELAAIPVESVATEVAVPPLLTVEQPLEFADPPDVVLNLPASKG